MARALVDLRELDLSRDVMPEAELRELIPHRHEFQLIDAVVHLVLERGLVVGRKTWADKPWWGPGHIPGRPLMPGVLLVEGSAQIATVLMKRLQGWGNDRFIGLAGLDEVRFRGQVDPGSTVYFVSAVGTTGSTRMARYPAQAFCNGKMVLDMLLLGVLL